MSRANSTPQRKKPPKTQLVWKDPSYVFAMIFMFLLWDLWDKWLSYCSFLLLLQLGKSHRSLDIKNPKHHWDAELEDLYYRKKKTSLRDQCLRFRHNQLGELFNPIIYLSIQINLIVSVLPAIYNVKRQLNPNWGLNIAPFFLSLSLLYEHIDKGPQWSRYKVLYHVGYPEIYHLP